MTTERRWGIRKPVEVDVVIDNQPACLLRGRIGDVSIGGLFVRTDPANLAPDAQIELVLMLHKRDGTQVYRMPAVVARIAPHGAGLRFDEYDVGTFRTLVVLLLTRQKGAARAAAPAKFQPRLGPRTPGGENGARTTLALEGTTGRIAAANGPAAPVTATSPAHGESH